MTDVTESNRVGCANCDWTGTRDEVEPYRDFWSRVQPGEIIPAGDCPLCGAFAYLTPEPVDDPDEEPETPRFKVFLQQYAEQIADVEVEAKDPVDAITKAKEQAVTLDWGSGDDSYEVEAYAVHDEIGNVVWER